MAVSGGNIGELLDDAAHDPSAWQGALSAIDAFLQSSGIVLLSVDERLKYAPCTANVSEMMEDYFRSGWHNRDLRESCVPLLKRQGFALDHQFLAMEQIETTEFYQDFLRLHRQKWFAGIGVGVGDDLWCLAVQQSRYKEAFQQRDVAKLKYVQTLLAKSVGAASRASRLWMNGALSALQSAGEAAFVLDWHGRLVHINEAGRQLIGRFIDGSGRLRLPDATANSIIAHSISSSKRWRYNSDIQSTPRPFLIGAKSYRLEAMILMNEPALAFSNIALMGRIHLHTANLDDLLKERYKLSPAEIRIATSLYEGSDVREIAEAFAVSGNTVRSHLKSIFRKTSTASQSKFLSLLLSLYRQ